MLLLAVMTASCFWRGDEKIPRDHVRTLVMRKVLCLLPDQTRSWWSRQLILVLMMWTLIQWHWQQGVSRRHLGDRCRRLSHSDAWRLYQWDAMVHSDTLQAGWYITVSQLQSTTVWYQLYYYYYYYCYCDFVVVVFLIWFYIVDWSSWRTCGKGKGKGEHLL